MQEAIRMQEAVRMVARRTHGMVTGDPDIALLVGTGLALIAVSLFTILEVAV